MNWTLYWQIVIPIIACLIIFLLLRVVQLRKREVEHRLDIRRLTEAIRLTVEYVGTDTLHALEGWSWYEALQRYAPEDAARFKEAYEREHGQRPRRPEDQGR